MLGALPQDIVVYGRERSWHAALVNRQKDREYARSVLMTWQQPGLARLQAAGAPRQPMTMLRILSLLVCSRHLPQRRNWNDSLMFQCFNKVRVEDDVELFLGKYDRRSSY